MKILSNKQPLLQICNPEINNTDLFIKSVIAHIIAFYASVEPYSSQLAMYLHRLQDCQNLFIIANYGGAVTTRICPDCKNSTKVSSRLYWRAS